ncbi:hypothetical protein IMCC3317_19960 [Kordia antarctica]|uniref:Photosystem I assembly protein Ycf3 n=1 Tax=Kordia antarctica TaxID=1218801 RepID=A0A7L4ZIU5_9FLAO|nr:SIR2 family protein [Kordia antarctica]QHI36633.1 hypothetical protein IMCC3317_19960 [Kordia antarctica]
MVKRKELQEPKKISQKRLVRIFKDIKGVKSEDNRFCFLIGAGASKSSGIQTGWELSEEWYQELQDDLEVDELKTWEKAIKFDAKKVGEFYSHLYKKRYESCHQVGYDKFKRIMESAEPGLGYVILARLLADEKHNFVITTNFDYLIEDAIRMYTATKPFTAGHEIMAQFISSQTERPTIIKVHRDLLLNPFNDEEQTKKLKDEWGKALLPIVKNFSLLVIGYGGNDGSLMDYLTEIDAKDRKPIYWCIRNEDDLNDKIRKLLTSNDFIVEIKGFDELMHSFNFAMDYKIFKDLDDIDNHQFVIAAKKRVETLKEKKRELLERLQKEKPEDISEETREIFTSAERYLLKIAYEEDTDKKEDIFKEAIERFPDNVELLNDYAIFLKNSKKDYDKAELYYNKVKELAPESGIILGNIANFLTEVRGNHELAEKYYEEAILYKKNDSVILGNYAIFLGTTQKKYDKAEKYHYMALSLDENNANNLGNLGNLLILRKKDFKTAKEYIEKSFKYTKEDQLDLLAELWFYRYTHYSEWREEAEKELDKLVAKGAKSIGWNFEDHITIAKENGHPNIKKLQEFADAISKE